jgi:hypothetical protein
MGFKLPFCKIELKFARSGHVVDEISIPQMPFELNDQFI